jgi:uncharacterized protein YqgV (UPF0045/DUF77 family)
MKAQPMDATVEISLYALQDKYKHTVLQFIEALHRHTGLTIETNGLSTQIFGDYDLIMQTVLAPEMKQVLLQAPAVFVLKLGRGILRYPEPQG